MGGSRAPRRVTVVGPALDALGDGRGPVRRAYPGPTVSRGDPPPNGSSHKDRLLDAIEGLAGLIRCGDVGEEASDGVLLDAVVDDIRFVMSVHVPSLQVELSPREQQIALMVAGGRTNQAIASALEISVWTVSTHLRRVFAKLAVSSRAEMVAHLLAQPEFASQIDQSPLA